jgi:hypothetical protein
MTSNNALTLNHLRAELEELANLERDTSELREQLLDSVSRNRMRPNMLSDAYIIALCQKLTKLQLAYGTLADHALTTRALASNLES